MNYYQKNREKYLRNIIILVVKKKQKSIVKIIRMFLKKKQALDIKIFSEEQKELKRQYSRNRYQKLIKKIINNELLLG